MDTLSLHGFAERFLLAPDELAASLSAGHPVARVATGIGKVSRYCMVHRTHRPHILYVHGHHICPQEYQKEVTKLPGESHKAVPDQRLVWMCPSGHENLHGALRDLKRGEEWTNIYSEAERALALLGYERYVKYREQGSVDPFIAQMDDVGYHLLRG